MLSRMASFGIAGLVIVGGTVALAAPAEAAAKKCAVGTWTLTKLAATYKETLEDETSITKATGGTGIELKITPSAAIYDFSKSKPVILSAIPADAGAKVRFIYRKSLRYGLTLTGAAKGTFTPKLKTVSGAATLRGVVGQSNEVFSQRLAPLVRKGDDIVVISVKAVSTCTKKTLTLSQKIEANDGSITTRKLSFRRTK